MADPLLPVLLPALPDWGRPHIDSKRVDQWDRACHQWALEWDDTTRFNMYYRIIAVYRNNMHEALDSMRRAVDAQYAEQVKAHDERRAAMRAADAATG